MFNYKYVLLYIFVAINVFIFVKCEHESNSDHHLIIHGDKLLLEREFYMNGTIKYEGTFLEKNDTLLQHGYLKYYNKNGDLEYYGNFDNGKRAGSVIYYFSNGNIKEYWFYNPIGQALYSLQYDSTGNVLKEQGASQRKPQIVSQFKSDSIVDLNVYSAEIPGFDKELYLIHPNGLKLDSILNTEDLLYDKFSEVNMDKGEYKIVANYYDSYALVESDTTKIDLLYGKSYSN